VTSGKGSIVLITNPDPLPLGLIPASFRQIAMFATGIAVISAYADDGQVHGMTVSSFTSISLDPPRVMVSFLPGRMHDLITQGGRYSVSVLGSSQRDFSAYLSKRVLEDSPAPVFNVREELPMLVGALAWLECKVEDSLIVQDYTQFIARVTACGISQSDVYASHSS